MAARSGNSRKLSTAPIERRFPWRELRAISRRQGSFKPAIYSVHRWWARRPPELYRTILTHLRNSPGHGGSQILKGKVVLDPFMGGGTTLVEAQALGAEVVGFDTEALACRITDLELSSAPRAQVWVEIEQAIRIIERKLRRYYGKCSNWEVLHLFWVDVVECGGCGRCFDAHPRALLARDYKAGWAEAFCRFCSRLHEVHGSRTTIKCSCGHVSRFQDSNSEDGKYRCPWCNHEEGIRRYVYRREGVRPERRLIAKEEINLKTRMRRFRSISRQDEKRFQRARLKFGNLEKALPIAKARVLVQPGDSRPRSYGFKRYRDMFNARQLLHHGSVLETFAKLEEPARSIAILAFSESLQTNCMFCPYSTDWRRLAALFSIHGYMYVSRPVELNPWFDGVGRGTLRNCVRRIRRALESKAKRDSVSAIRLHFGSVDAIQGDGIRADYVVTDPPYYDNLDYEYLARFHSSWLAQVPFVCARLRKVGGTAIKSIQRKESHASEEFYRRLRQIFRACRKRLKRNGLFVFTFAQRKASAWMALGRAIRAAGFRVSAVYGVETEGKNGFHSRPGNLRWNAIFVCRKIKSGLNRTRVCDLSQGDQNKGSFSR